MFTNTHLHVTSQHHDVTSTLIAIQCDSLCTNCRFLNTGLVDHKGVIQTPITSTFHTPLFTWNSHFMTVIKIPLGQPCSAGEVCQDSYAICAGTCQCHQNYYHAENNTCGKLLSSSSDKKVKLFSTLRNKFISTLPST